MVINFSDELNNYVKPFRYKLKESWRGLVGSGHFREKYVHYLIQTYHYIKYSCPFMSLVSSRLDCRYGPLIKYLSNHICEEVGHDGWVLDDLKKLGYDEDLVKRTLPLRETVSFISSQFYILDVNPIGYLGYIYALESTPRSLKAIKSLSENFNIPLEAMTTLIGHAKEDPSHIRDLEEILNSAPINLPAQQIIKYNAKITLENAADFITAVGRIGINSSDSFFVKRADSTFSSSSNFVLGCFSGVPAEGGL